MNKRELARVALSEGDIENRISALLELLQFPLYECKMPEGQLHLPEEECANYHNGDCWINIPDSVYKCNGVCSNFE